MVWQCSVLSSLVQRNYYREETFSGFLLTDLKKKKKKRKKERKKETER